MTGHVIFKELRAKQIFLNWWKVYLGPQSFKIKKIEVFKIWLQSHVNRIDLKLKMGMTSFDIYYCMIVAVLA